MRYEFSSEQLAWRDEVRAFLRTAVRPALVAEMREAGNEGDGPLARAFHRKMFDKGWWGIAWPKEFGGLGKTAIEQFIFVGVRVPRDHLVGERGMGFYYAMMALDFERIMIGSVGMLRRLLDELKGFIRRARRDGAPLGAIPWVRRALADLEMRVEVGR